MNEQDQYLNKAERAFLRRSIKQKRTNQRLIYGSFLGVIVVLSVLSIYLNTALDQEAVATRAAEEQGRIADSVAKDARDTARVAQEQRKLAGLAAQEAKNNAEIAQMQRELAIQSQRYAEAQRDSAEKARLFAIVSEREAEIARDSAETLADELQSAKDSTEKRRKRSELLNAQLLGNQAINSSVENLTERISMISMAKQAYEIHTDSTNEGDPHNHTVYLALHEANQVSSESELSYNYINHVNNRGAFFVGGLKGYFYSGEQNKIVQWYWSKNQWLKHDSITPFSEPISTMRLFNFSNIAESYLTVGSKNGNIKIYLLDNGKWQAKPVNLFLKDKGEILDFVVSYDMSQLVISTQSSENNGSSQLYLYDFKTQIIREFPFEIKSSLNSLAMHKSGQYIIATNSTYDLLLIDTEFNKSPDTIYPTKNINHKYIEVRYQKELDMWAATYSPDGQFLSSQIVVWKYGENSELYLQNKLNDFEGNIMSMAFSSSGKYIIAGTSRGEVSIWRTISGEYEEHPIRINLRRKRISDLSFCGNDEMFISVATTDRSHEIYYWYTQIEDLYKRLSQR